MNTNIKTAEKMRLNSRLGSNTNEKDKDRVVKRFILDGLNCAHCAIKIETKVKEIKGVNNSSINFATKILSVEIDNEKEIDNVISSINQIVNETEPGVKLIDNDANCCSACSACEIKVSDDHGHSSNKAAMNSDEKQSRWKEFIYYGLSLTLFIVGVIFDFSKQLELVIFLAAYILAGGEIVLSALKNITRGNVFDENFLMSVATIGAFVIGEYPEAVAVMLFYHLGMFLEDLAVGRSRRSIAALMDISPEYANLKVGEDVKKVSPGDVKVGDIIIVKPGEKVPLDGVVIEGRSMLDTSVLTGESVPREVDVGDNVLAGFINKNGVLVVEVKKEFQDTVVSRILDLVQNASSRKAPTEKFINRFARYYTPVVTATAAAIAFIPPLVIPGAAFSEWFYRAMVFLVVSCPCALVVSIPLGFFAGIGRASRNGILVKGSNYLEALNNVDTVVFDKTGTLTKGTFKVTSVKPGDNFSRNELLKYAAHAEAYSNHPIAVSIVNEYGKEVDVNEIEDYNEISGMGISVRVMGKAVLAGNIKLMEKEGIACDIPETTGTIVHVAVDGKYAGYIEISDEVKEDSARAIKSLKDIGVKKLVMLTGDNRVVSEKIGKQLGLSEIHAELLPDQKVEKLEVLLKEEGANGKLVFVGDGINDAPVLARADIGVAMGGLGSDAAIEAADVVIMTDEPSKLVSAIKIARKTHRIIWQNIVFSLGVKLIVLALGALGVATMWEAVFADTGVTLIAVLNSMRVNTIDNV